MESKKIQEMREKPKEFITPDSYQIGNELSILKKSASNFLDVIDRLVNLQKLHISKSRGAIATGLVNRAVRVMLAYKDNSKDLSLNNSQKRRVLQMADDVLNGRRTAVQFQSLINGNGIVELFSNEVFEAREDELFEKIKTQEQ